MTSLSSCSEVASVCHSAAQRSGERRPRFAQAGPGSAEAAGLGCHRGAGGRALLPAEPPPGRSRFCSRHLGPAPAPAAGAPREQPPLPAPPVTAAAGRVGSREPAPARKGAPAPAGHRERPLLGSGQRGRWHQSITATIPSAATGATIALRCHRHRHSHQPRDFPTAIQRIERCWRCYRCYYRGNSANYGRIHQTGGESKSTLASRHCAGHLPVPFASEPERSHNTYFAR